MSQPLIIVNPASASGKTGRRWPKLASRVLQALPGARIVHTQAKGDGARLAREAITEGVKHIVAVGGDGTIHEVVNGLFDPQGQPLAPDLTLSPIPMGTGSDLCRSLGLPRDPEEAVKHLKGPGRPIDAGWVRKADGSGEAFINIASVGLSGQVAKHFEEHGKGGGLSYLMGIFTASSGYQNQALRLTLTYEDGRTEQIERTCYACAVANARYFGSGMPIAPDAIADDGVFQLVIVGDLSLGEVTRRLPALYRGSHLNKPKFESFDVTRVSFEPLGETPVWVELDGEHSQALPASFEVRPASLKITTGPSAPVLPRRGVR